MTFPIISDYITAMRNASNRFATLDVELETDDGGNPMFLAGNFAAVFKATTVETGHAVALKVFTRNMPQLERRYNVISRVAAQMKSNYFLSLGFMPEELYVTSHIAESKSYPVVVMPWAEGEIFGSVIKRVCSNNRRKGLAALTRSWATLCLDLLSKGIAHGDLKHDNVLVMPNGRLRLIDYDSIYAPPLKGLRSVLLGGASYQHPRRDIRHFDGTMDHFSMLVVALSLRALTIEPSLYAAYNTGENIILTRDDFTSQYPTELITTLQECPDALVRTWTNMLINASRSPFISVPDIRRVLQDAQGATDEPQANIRRGFFDFQRSYATA